MPMNARPGYIAALILSLILWSGTAFGDTLYVDSDKFVTDEPGDQKGNMDMYKDAEGPPAMGFPVNGSTRMQGWGQCMKPAVQIDTDEYGNGIYAEDHEVIWRCLQTNPTGELIPTEKAPVVYCFIQNPLIIQKTDQPYFSCYHNYGDQFLTYEHQWGKSPLILMDEVEFVPTTEFREP